MSCVQKILTVALFPNLTTLINTKPVFSKTDNNYWLPVTTTTVGESILNNIDNNQLSGNNFFTIKVFYFCGARIWDISQFIQPIINTEPEFLILHIETNDATAIHFRKIVDEFLLLKLAILKSLSDCKALKSKPRFTSNTSKYD